MRRLSTLRQSLYVLARLGGAEISAIIGGAVFVVIMGFLLLGGGPPNRER
jgi:hypothetical protein